MKLKDIIFLAHDEGGVLYDASYQLPANWFMVLICSTGLGAFGQVVSSRVFHRLHLKFFIPVGALLMRVLAYAVGYWTPRLEGRHDSLRKTSKSVARRECVKLATSSFQYPGKQSRIYLIVLWSDANGLYLILILINLTVIHRGLRSAILSTAYFVHQLNSHPSLSVNGTKRPSTTSLTCKNFIGWFTFREAHHDHCRLEWRWLYILVKHVMVSYWCSTV